MSTLTELAQSAYGGAARRTIATPRDIEYQAFVYVTALMTDARDARDLPDTARLARMAEAMHQNVRLWAALAADCASDGNKLPNPLRNAIIDLANFARIHMARVIDGKDTIDALIDVNLSIMKGLKGLEGGAA
jgi:flagellar protein FlaF